VAHRCGTGVPGLVLVVLCSVACQAANPPFDISDDGAGVPKPGKELMVNPQSTSGGGIHAFKTLAGEYKRTFAQRMQYNQEMRTKNALPRVPEGPVTYSKVPWFALKANSLTHRKFTYDDCQLYCTTYISCRSFSYNVHGQLCISSESSMAYDPNFVFYTKKVDVAGKSLSTYESFAGLKFEVSAEVASRGRSFEECEYICTRAKQGCSGFSYSEADNVCIRTAEKLHYSPDYDYYEKNEESTSTIQTKKEQSENEGKKKKRDLFELKFEQSKKDEEKEFSDAVAKKQAEEKFEKHAEHHMQIQAEMVKEKRKKLVIAAKKANRYELEAKEQGVSVEEIRASEKAIEIDKEVAQKKAMSATDSEAKTEANLKVDEATQKEEHIKAEKEEKAGEAAKTEEQAREAAKKERKTQRSEEAAQQKEAEDQTAVKQDKLQEKLASKKEDMEKQKLSYEATKEEEVTTKTNEQQEKKTLAQDQASSEKKQKQCASELDQSRRKEICLKANEMKAEGKGDFVAEDGALKEEMDVASKARGSETEMKADRQRIRRMRKMAAFMEKKAKAKAMKKEHGEKAKITAEKEKAEADEKQRQHLKVEDGRLLRLAQAKENKSKMAQMADMKANIIEQQEDAKQDEINAKATVRFNHVLKKETFENAEKESKKLKELKVKDATGKAAQEKNTAAQVQMKHTADNKQAETKAKAENSAGAVTPIGKDGSESTAVTQIGKEGDEDADPSPPAPVNL